MTASLMMDVLLARTRLKVSNGLESDCLADFFFTSKMGKGGKNFVSVRHFFLSCIVGHYILLYFIPSFVVDFSIFLGSTFRLVDLFFHAITRSSLKVNTLASHLFFLSVLFRFYCIHSIRHDRITSLPSKRSFRRTCHRLRRSFFFFNCHAYVQILPYNDFFFVFVLPPCLATPYRTLFFEPTLQFASLIDRPMAWTVDKHTKQKKMV